MSCFMFKVRNLPNYDVLMHVTKYKRIIILVYFVN